MTARQIFRAMLIECSKVNAPSLLLREYNYYINKAINNYINKRYNIYDINQQTTDDVRVLKSSAILIPTLTEPELTSPTSRLGYSHPEISKLQAATYEVKLPADYLHLLNCTCVFKVNKNIDCYDGGSYVSFPAKRLTSDSWSTIMNDFYNRPSYENPYYYIHNVNVSNEIPTNPISYNDNMEYVGGTDAVGLYDVTLNGEDNSNSEAGYNTQNNNTTANFPRVIKVGNSNINISTVEKPTGYRSMNPSTVRMEIRYGRDNSVFELVEVKVDYIKTPQTIRLTQEQVDLTEDTSQIMEYPDYVCQEIINELTTLIMIRTNDPIANGFVQVKETIANPAQQQQPQQNQS